ncbi:glycosyltransferase family 1 protein [Acinetobacter towneri]|nr:MULTISPECIES: glycosyltransferase [Acinetobacter]MCA4778586.1 glycosyltransferase family 1 protein [Acinetobacter towneri]MCA4783914.1 glycosyltransferase family 1 protein [Acinetobacter towneri]MCA4786416.1 glycosyltransferase family 1 protein [Acinetobacter towneri]MCA4795198.1 glycosyltransferase family 1 protein [Acinetobacter towneri]MCA4800093.1 glycosyltransferase family 1 protein [Acinetobacter towneri]
MKILHIANFAFNKLGERYYSIDRKISAGLIENGHFVYDYSFRDMARMGTIFKTKKLGSGVANNEVLKIVENLCPELVLIGHSDLLKKETLQTIRKNYPSIKIGFWFVDWLCEQSKANFIREFAPYVDAIFCTTGGRLLTQFKLPNNKIGYIPNIAQKSIEELQQFNKDFFLRDFIFFGTVYKDPDREVFLTHLVQSLGENFHCFGAFDNKAVYGHKYIDILSSARCGLNLSRRNDIELYSSDRIVQLTGNGLLTFTPRIPGFEKLYTDKEVVYFDDLKDLIEKFEYYKMNTEQAKVIAENGWKKSHQSFNSARVAKYMLEVIFDQPLSEAYEWAHEVYI